MSTIARYYDLSKSEDGRRFISGVPARDITVEEWDALPPHLQRSVDASDIYRKTRPPKKDGEGDN
jgi:hypothetical protein